MVDIGHQELEEEGIPQIAEIKEGEFATWLHLKEEPTEGQSKCLLSCYDMGGHTEYYNSQQVSNLITHFRDNIELTSECVFLNRYLKLRSRHT